MLNLNYTNICDVSGSPRLLLGGSRGYHPGTHDSKGPLLPQVVTEAPVPSISMQKVNLRFYAPVYLYHNFFTGLLQYLAKNMALLFKKFLGKFNFCQNPFRL